MQMAGRMMHGQMDREDEDFKLKNAGQNAWG
jgi:hypothetical protein